MKGVKKIRSYKEFPKKVTFLGNGSYSCNITEVSIQDTKYGKAIVVKLELKYNSKKIPFLKYFNIDFGIISGSEIYTFLDSMNAITEGNILWDKIKGASVIATIESNDNGKLRVKKITPANSSSIDAPEEDDDEYEEDDDEYYEDDDEYYEDDDEYYEEDSEINDEEE